MKSCTLAEDGCALFPDAPIKRGARHTRRFSSALMEKIANQTVVVFIIQKPDVEVFSPNNPTNPEFANALRIAATKGLKVYALQTKAVDWDLQLLDQVPVELGFFSTSH